MSEFKIWAAISSLVALGIASVIIFATRTPLYEIHFSYSTKECVRVVEIYQNELTYLECPEVLPRKYKHVWVK